MKFTSLILILLFSLGLQAQVKRPDTNNRPVGRSSRAAVAPKDTVKLSIADSLISKGNGLTTTVKRYAKDSVSFKVKSKSYQLYTDAKVQYGTTKLAADYILLDWGKNEVYAHGMPDTTKKVGSPVRGKPVFEDGPETYHMDTIRYNFQSKKAKIYSIATEQGEGYIHGKVVKKDQYDNLHLGSAKYTTCSLAEPHFHIAAKKIMFINKKSAISGPFNIVVHDIPLPVGFFFGFFPVQPKQEMGTSGFIMGRYGEQRGDGRGFFFNDFGYYHAFNEQLGSSTTVQLYTQGSWGIKEQLDYAKKYKYTGKVSLQFNENVQSDQFGLKEKNKYSKQFEFAWNHSPQSLRTDRSFSSNITLRSSGFAASNIHSSNTNAVLQNSTGGSLNFMRNFGKLYTSTYSLSATQNRDDFSSGLTYSMGLKQFNPFIKEKKQTGKFFDSFRVGVNLNGGISTTNIITARSTSYTDYNLAGVSNSPLTAEEQKQINDLNIIIVDFTRTEEAREEARKKLAKLQNPRLKVLDAIFNNSRITNSYSVPIVLPNIKILKFINLTPSVSLSGNLYDRKLDYIYVNESKEITLSSGNKVYVNVDEKLDSTISYSRDSTGLKVNMGHNAGGVVVIDTIQGLNFANQMAFGASMNTRFYGTFRFKEKSKIQAIRHTVNPSLSFSYTPQNTLSAHTKVRSDGAMRYLPRYIGGSGGSSRDAGNIGFSINNQLEAKVRSTSDTSETNEEKIMLLDNLSIGGSYNIFARQDSVYNEFALSDISLATSTALFKRKVNINASASLDPYQYVTDNVVKSNVAGIRVPQFKWRKNKDENGDKLNVGQYLTSLTLNVNTSLNPEVFKGKAPSRNIMPGINPDNNLPLNPMDYVDFNIPWNVSVSYSFNYTKQGLADSRVMNALSLTGDVSFTKNTKITFSSGWDFQFKQITLTTIGITRELHCWMFSLNWTPISGSSMRSGGFDFTLRPKASLLKDLKITRRRLGSY